MSRNVAHDRLSWTYTGPSVAGRNLTLTALGNQGDQLNTTTGDDIPITEQLVTVDATDTSVDYLVKLRYGRYYLHGQINLRPSYGVNSNLFWVQEGTDLSCLTATGSDSSSGVSNSAGPSTTASTAPSASASASAADADAGSSSSSIGSGAIAGIAVGAVVGLAVVALALYFCCYNKRRASRRPEISHLGGGHVPQRVSKHFPLQSVGGSADSHEKDEAALYGTDPSTPNYLAQYSPAQSRRDPFSTVPNTPQAHGDATFSLDEEFGGAAAAAGSATTPRDARRQSQPLSPSAQTSPRSRSNSQPSDGPSGKVNVKRNVSARRKPVPSLGAELKSQLAQQQGGDSGNQKEHLRSSFQLMPDPPKPINE